MLILLQKWRALVWALHFIENLGGSMGVLPCRAVHRQGIVGLCCRRSQYTFLGACRVDGTAAQFRTTDFCKMAPSGVRYQNEDRAILRTSAFGPIKIYNGWCHLSTVGRVGVTLLNRGPFWCGRPPELKGT